MNTEFKFDGTKLLEGVDLPEGRVFELEIAGVIPPNVARSANKQLIDKPIIVFKKDNKNQFIAGKTCERVIKMLYGGEYTDWVGETIKIQRRYLLEAFGCRNCAVIRVIPPKGSGMSFRVFKQMGSAVPFDDDGKPIVRSPDTTKKKKAKPATAEPETITASDATPEQEPSELTEQEALYVADCTNEIAAADSIEVLTMIHDGIETKSDAVKGVLRPLWKARKDELTPEKE